MNKRMISLLLGVSLLAMPVMIANAASTGWQPVSNYGQTEKVYYIYENKASGWTQIDDKWYYFYSGTGYMAHDTFIDGYYVNSEGVWTDDVPYAIQRVIDVVPDSNWIYTYGNDTQDYIGILENKNFKELCRYGWNAPDVNGTVVSTMGEEFFVSSNGTVYKAPHQAYDTIYEYGNDGSIVASYPYVGK